MAAESVATADRNCINWALPASADGWRMGVGVAMGVGVGVGATAISLGLIRDNPKRTPDTTRAVTAIAIMRGVEILGAGGGGGTARDETVSVCGCKTVFIAGSASGRGVAGGTDGFGSVSIGC